MFKKDRSARPYRKRLNIKVEALRRKMKIKCEAMPGHPFLGEMSKISEDFTNAVWCLREMEMNLQQRQRDAHVRRYRPIRTLNDDPLKDAHALVMEIGPESTWID